MTGLLRRFKYIEDSNYGPFLTSVNGLAGCPTMRTYWELLVKKAGGRVFRPDVGESESASLRGLRLTLDQIRNLG